MSILLPHRQACWWRTIFPISRIRIWQGQSTSHIYVISDLVTHFLKMECYEVRAKYIGAKKKEIWSAVYKHAEEHNAYYSLERSKSIFYDDDLQIVLLFVKKSINILHISQSVVLEQPHGGQVWWCGSERHESFICLSRQYGVCRNNPLHRCRVWLSSSNTWVTSYWGNVVYYSLGFVRMLMYDDHVYMTDREL